MAITLANINNSGNIINGSGCTVSYTTTSNTKGLAVIITSADSIAADAIANVTFNGDSLTELRRYRYTPYQVSIFYKELPYIGTANLIVTMGGVNTDLQVTTVCLESTSTSIIPHTYAEGSDSTTSQTLVINATSGMTNSIALGGIVFINAAITALSVSAGTEIAGSEADMGSQVVGCAYAYQSGTTTTITWAKTTVTASHALMYTFYEQYEQYEGWYVKPLKYWNGSAWVTKPLKYWNGSAWVQASRALMVSQGVLPSYAYGWGNNYYGQCGRGDTISPKTNVAKTSNTDNNWSQISCGDYHVLGIKGGYLYAWGYNGSGQLGNNTLTDSPTPIQIGMYNDWSYVYAGTSCSFAIRGGYLYAWGDNSYQQLGLPTGTYLTPTQVGSFNDWVKVANGSNNHTLAIRGNGLLYGVGRNSWNMLGTGNSTNLTELTQIGTETGWTHVGAGSYHSLAIRDGKLWSTGLNNNGQLGHADSNVFLQIGTDSDWSDISVYQDSNFALKTNGKLYAWGTNDYNQLGLLNSSTLPTYVMSGVKKLDMGFTVSCVINNEGKLFVVGYNGGGELGLGDTLNRTSFTAVGLDTDWVACQATQAGTTIIALKHS